MISKKKVLKTEHIPEFETSIAVMPLDSKIFVEKSLEIAHYIFKLMEEKDMKQKDLADKLGKSEAEVSKWLAGMHNFTLRSLTKLEAALGARVICTPKNVYISVRPTSYKYSKPGIVERKYLPEGKTSFTPVIKMYGNYSQQVNIN